MQTQPELKHRAYVPPMLFLGVILICGAVEVVRAASAPQDDFLDIQAQLMKSNRAKDAKYERPFSENAQQSGADTSHKGDKIVTVELLGRPGIPPIAPPEFTDRPGPGPAPSAGPFPFPDGLPPRLAPREACLEDINRQMALTGYMKIKLRLSEGQKADWKAVEEVFDAAVPIQRALCESLPNKIVGPPATVERYEFLEKHLSTRLELLRSLKAPLLQLIGKLSPDQRAALDGLSPFGPL